MREGGRCRETENDRESHYMVDRNSFDKSGQLYRPVVTVKSEEETDA